MPTAMLLVLYPTPLDAEEFERKYLGEHMPLMRKLVGPDIPLPTFRAINETGPLGPIYRVAQILFPNMEALRNYVGTERSKPGRASSMAVSTGGHPTYIICESDPEV